MAGTISGAQMRLIIPPSDVNLKVCRIHKVPFYRVGRDCRKDSTFRRYRMIGECPECNRVRSRVRMRKYRLRNSPDPQALMMQRKKKKRAAAGRRK